MDEKGIKRGDDIPNLTMVNWRRNNNGRISSSIRSANQEPTETYKKETTEKIKQKPKRNLKNRPSKKKWKVGLAIALASIIAATGTGLLVHNYKESKENTTGYTEKSEDLENDSDIILEEKITSIEGVEKDFVDKYLKAYNDKYNTNYASAEMSVTELNEGIVYQTQNGDQVTRGKNPYETEKFLMENEGGCAKVSGYDKVYQILVDNGQDGYEILGTYSLDGEFIYSGNQLSDLTDEDFIKPQLVDLGINPDKAKKAAEVIAADGVENENSIKSRIEAYQNTTDVIQQVKDTQDLTK